MNEIGHAIKQARKKAGLTQQELAKKMGYKSSTTICKIESGENSVTLDTIARLADVLNVTVAELQGLPKPIQTKEEYNSGLIESVKHLLANSIETKDIDFTDDEINTIAGFVKLLSDAKKGNK